MTCTIYILAPVTEFLNMANDIDEVMHIFDVLEQIDTQNQDKRYFPSVFEIVFKYLINETNKDIEFVNCFSDKMKSGYLQNYIIEERKVVSKNILMQGNIISNDILEYLLDFLKMEDIISVLFFRLAYAERSGRKVMNSEEFKVWENAINRCKVESDIEDLNKYNFVSKLCNELSNSNVSHFIFKVFIEWLWSSLFEVFDERKYIEFKKLGEKGIRRNFNLKNYIILRLLLCQFSYTSIFFYTLDEPNKNQIKKELSDIKDILNIKGIYVYK